MNRQVRQERQEREKESEECKFIENWYKEPQRRRGHREKKGSLNLRSLINGVRIGDYSLGFQKIWRSNQTFHRLYCE